MPSFLQDTPLQTSSHSSTTFFLSMTSQHHDYSSFGQIIHEQDKLLNDPKLDLAWIEQGETASQLLLCVFLNVLSVSTFVFTF